MLKVKEMKPDETNTKILCTCMMKKSFTTCLQDAPKKFSPFLLVPLLSRVHFDHMICQYSLICVMCIYEYGN